MSRPTTELAYLIDQLKAPAAVRALPKLADRARAEDWSYGLRLRSAGEEASRWPSFRPALPA